jgi:hypothetical protein
MPSFAWCAVYILLALNVIVPCAVAWKFSVSGEGISVNHVLVFTSGYLFYWILPIAIGSFRLLSSEPALRLWYQIFDSIAVTVIIEYLLLSLVCYLAFSGGAYLGRLPQKTAHYDRLYLDKRLLFCPLIFGVALALVYAFLLRDQLFHGYTGWTADDDAQANLRSTFTASSVFLLGCAFVYSLKRSEDSGEALPFRKVIANPFFIAYWIVAVLVLSLGGRLYFVSSVVMLFVYRTNYFKRITVKNAIISAVACFVLAGLAGVSRLQGSGGINGGSVAMNVFLEPLLTSLSLIYFLAHDTFGILRIPIFLLGDLLNLVPTALLPNKANYLPKPDDYGHIAFSPGGALNSFFSWMINFGALGTVIVLFAAGFAVSRLRKRDSNLLNRLMYTMICGWIGFTCFRDDFAISLVKTIFEFSIIVPAILVISAQLITLLLRPDLAPRRLPRKSPGLTT